MPDQCDYQVLMHNAYMGRCGKLCEEKEPAWFDGQTCLQEVSTAAVEKIDVIGNRIKAAVVATG